ncbi:MAG: hypothetical protein IH843_07085 [Thaumarchaeota archaeon]|nr:hypothetical protein [Nitrososphaerota archaeon]
MGKDRKEKEEIRRAELKIAEALFKCRHVAEDGGNSLEVWHVGWNTVEGQILGANEPDLDSPKLSKATRMVIDYFRKSDFEVYVQHCLGPGDEIQTYAISIRW